MKFAIISIGTELNLGLIQNTNSQYIAENLAGLGLECNYMYTARDNEDEIVKIISEAINKSDILILSGGLGPTDDDITREAIAKTLNIKLVRDKNLDKTSLRFLKRIHDENLAKKLKKGLLRQSFIPEGSIPIKPRIGSAAGFIIKMKPENKWLFSIPGVPKEMKDMFDLDVTPYLKHILKNSKNTVNDAIPGSQNFFIKKSELLTTDISESETELKISSIKPEAKALNVEIGITANPGLIKLILIAKAPDVKTCTRNLKIIEEKIKVAMEDYIYGTDSSVIGNSLKAVIDSNSVKQGGRKITISAAESITGGLISSMITDIPGSSDFFLGSIISYSNFAKVKILGIDEKMIKKSGAVSAQVGLEMAINTKKMFNSDYAISVTGIAGPDSPEKGKRVGLVYCAVSGPDGFQQVFEKNFLGNRAEVKFRTAQFILNKLRLTIKNSCC